MQGQNEVESLYREYSGDVYRYLLYMCRNPHVAEALCRSTFLKVISGIRGFRGSCPVKTWIFTIARHEYFHWLRQIRQQRNCGRTGRKRRTAARMWRSSMRRENRRPGFFRI